MVIAPALRIEDPLRDFLQEAARQRNRSVRAFLVKPDRREQEAFRRRRVEQGGFRPAVVVQADPGHHAPGARTAIVVPLAAQGRVRRRRPG